MVDIAGVAIKPTHTGKGLLTKMIEVCLVQSQKHNFQFAYCYVSNCKTSSSLRRQGFKKIVEVNSK
jgi:N-acetylglutamate synthase-like GNAT family acetyltransferase